MTSTWPVCPTCERPLPRRRVCAHCGLGETLHVIRKDGTRGGADFIAGPRGERVQCPGFQPQEGDA